MAVTTFLAGDYVEEVANVGVFLVGARSVFGVVKFETVVGENAKHGCGDITR